MSTADPNAQVRLGDYVTDDGQYFYLKGRVYVTARVHISGDLIGAQSWDTGEFSRMDPDEKVHALDRPPRPQPPADSFIYCKDSTDEEVRQSFLRYRRQMEEYASVLEKELSK